MIFIIWVMYIDLPAAWLFQQRNILKCFPYLNMGVTWYFAHLLSSCYYPAFIVSQKYLAITYKQAMLNTYCNILIQCQNSFKKSMCSSISKCIFIKKNSQLKLSTYLGSRSSVGICKSLKYLEEWSAFEKSPYLQHSALYWLMGR